MMPDGERERRPESTRPKRPGPASGAAGGRLNERVHAVLSEAITDGSLSTGAVVRESALIKRLKVTRAPVRQALRRLRDEGVLRRAGAGGHVVGDWSSGTHEADLEAVLARHAETAPIRKAPAWTLAYDAIERVVIHRAAFGRTRLNEIELSRHFGVGRAAVRDVLMRLELLGMLERDASQHWSVVALDAERVRNLNDMREQLEPAALQGSFASLRRERVAKMRERLLSAIDHYPDVEPETMDALENDLHLGCLDGCPNKELLAALRRTHCVLTLSKHVLGTAMPIPAADPFLQEHAVVVDRLMAADGPGAMAMLARHIASATPKVVERLAAFRAGCEPPEFSFFRS